MKLIKSNMGDMGLAWIMFPDICYISSLRKELSYLDIFYFFGQNIFNGNNKDLLLFKEEVLKDLNNRVFQIQFYAKKIHKQEKVLISMKCKRNYSKRRVYDYNPYQIYLAYLQSYLDALHSIGDVVKRIETKIGGEFYKKLECKVWYKLEMSIRHLIHHIETPLVFIDNKNLKLIFKKADLLHKNNYISKDFIKKYGNKDGWIIFKSPTKDIDFKIIQFLNKWAKYHLSKLNKGLEINIIKGFKVDFKHNYRKVTLEELLSSAINIHSTDASSSHSSNAL